ncbi:hypothetical protein OK074_5325 [Actinobacteria bacterium OK074]|nr:hypothetical protein OK074_5325 [Actinobacteria bacterium OK074]
MTVTTLIAAAEPPRKPEPTWTCFVIGPIGDGHTEADASERKEFEHYLRVFERVIFPACAEFGIVAVRADRITQAGDINEQICRHVLQDDLVIADVSGGNPNVMYELGLRHVTGKPTIHIGERGQLPFDIAPIRTIRYDRTLSGLSEARTEIERALEVGIRDGFDLLTPARVLRGLQTSDTGLEPADAGEKPDDEDAPGLLDEFAAIEDGLEELTLDMDAIGEKIETITALTHRSAEEMEGHNQAGVPMSARMATIARYADSINVPAEELNQAAQLFAGRMATLDSGVRAALALIEMTPPDERGDGAEEFLGQLMSLAETARESMKGLTGFGTATEGVGGMSRYLRGPAKKISSAVKRMTSAMACIDTWESTARSLKPDYDQ